MISENLDTWYYNWEVYDMHYDVNIVIEYIKNNFCDKVSNLILV